MFCTVIIEHQKIYDIQTDHSCCPFVYRPSKNILSFSNFLLCITVTTCLFVRHYKRFKLSDCRIVSAKKLFRFERVVSVVSSEVPKCVPKTGFVINFKFIWMFEWSETSSPCLFCNTILMVKNLFKF